MSPHSLPSAAAWHASAHQSRQQLRDQANQRRACRPASLRAADDQARTERLLAVLASNGITKLASYLSRPGEPDTLALARHWIAEYGVILVPVFTGWATTRAPKWAPYRTGGVLHVNKMGILVPATAPVDDATLTATQAVVVSALAADLAGGRLGTGGGWFDRALPMFADACLRICLLNDDEVVSQLPVLGHDQGVDVVVTPTRSLQTQIRTTSQPALHLAIEA